MIIATPYTFSGFHVAEALGMARGDRGPKACARPMPMTYVRAGGCGAGVPFFYICPFPWTRTRAFPQPFITPETSLGGPCALGAVRRHRAILNAAPAWTLGHVRDARPP
jgi:hypothetical protein